MKVKNLVVLLAFVGLEISCVMEAPATFYSFTIKNSTDYNIIVKLTDRAYDERVCDTIISGETFYVSTLEQKCYKEYKDSLISTLFSEFELSVISKKNVLDPYKYSNWKENRDSLSGLRCKSGVVNYFMEISSKMIK